MKKPEAATTLQRQKPEGPRTGLKHRAGRVGSTPRGATSISQSSAPLVVANEDSDESEGLAKSIRSDINKAKKRYTDAVAHAISAGEKLICAHEQLRHGKWKPFLKRCKLSRWTAANYMRLARKHAELSANGERAHHFTSVRSFLAAIAEQEGKKPPELEHKASPEYQTADNQAASDVPGRPVSDPTPLESVGLTGSNTERRSEITAPAVADRGNGFARGALPSFEKAEIERLLRIRQGRDLKAADVKLCNAIDRQLPAAADPIVSAAGAVAAGVSRELADAGIDPKMGPVVVLARLQHMIELPPSDRAVTQTSAKAGSNGRKGQASR